MKQKKYRIIKVFLIFLFFSSGFALEESINSLFKEAVTEYKNGNFSVSLEKFLHIQKELEKNKIISAEILYNIGNCYFKINKPGYARFYYELAKFYKYHDKNINYNLNLVKKLTNNNQEDSFIDQFINLLSFNETFILLFILNLVFFASLVSGMFSTSRIIKWVKRFTFVLFLIFLTLAIFKYIHDNRKTGIVVETTDLLSAPAIIPQTKSVQINEAKKVIVLSEKDEYYAVFVLQDKIHGWIKKDKVGIIKS
ncbi:MAG: hypothetical protein ABDH23_04510 [Endomicrobiia bacterium]